MTESPFTRRARAAELPASDRTGAYVRPEDRAATTADDAAAIVADAVGIRRPYTVADLRSAYARELSAGFDSDDSAERVARRMLS